MSTYGLVVVADLADADAAKRLTARVAAVLQASWWMDDCPADELEAEVVEHGAGVRASMNLPGMVADHREADFFTDCGPGRAVICEDGDEYGVVFQVWELSADGGRCVYRAYVWDSDGEPEPMTLERSITGAAAAAEAAELYGLDPQLLLDLERDPTPVSDELGVIGTPFDPWLEPFGVQWPLPW